MVGTNVSLMSSPLLPTVFYFHSFTLFYERSEAQRMEGTAVDSFLCQHHHSANVVPLFLFHYFLSEWNERAERVRETRSGGMNCKEGVRLT